MTQKSFLATCLLSCLAVFVIVHPLLFATAWGVPNERERYLAEWVEIKKHYAGTVNRPKLNIITASSALFGIDAARMERTLNIPVVNMGTHGTLGRQEFKIYRDNIKAGDIVLLPLEPVFYKDGSFGNEYTAYILGYKPEYFQELDLWKKIRFVYSMYSWDLLGFARERFLPKDKHETGYSSQHLDKNGDMTYYQNQRPLNNLSHDLRSDVYEHDVNISDEAKAELHEFVAWCNNNNIKVYATWSPMMYKDRSLTDGDKAAVATIRSFWEGENVPVLGEQAETLYPIEFFYDGFAHMNELGKEHYTDWLIAQLKPYM
ncbi:MAG: hypothetical protein IJ849_07815 [Selenomonadaceae bacterium]|nr:hypothetical protein [Selenomonadaceae bacterium]